eukprot:5983984-Pyramimonas_sp.AAC.1
MLIVGSAGLSTSQVTPLTTLEPVSEELPERAGKRDCNFYLMTGKCKFGGTCRFNHPKNRQAAAETAGIVSLEFNALGLPRRE